MVVSEVVVSGIGVVVSSGEGVVVSSTIVVVVSSCLWNSVVEVVVVRRRVVPVG